jgi:pyrroloquinoline quinone biosynthesis protein B
MVMLFATDHRSRGARFLLACSTLLACMACSGPMVGDRAEQSPFAYTILGTAQDAGMPHIGCDQPICQQGRAERRHEAVAAVGISATQGWWLLDATPDLPAQIHAMGEMPRGIFLTHAHIGHYTGLMYLGREALGAKNMPVWCSPRMADFLRNNGPWNQLIELGQIELHLYHSDQPVELEPGLHLTPLPVPHRDEYSDTHAFLVENQTGGSVLFVPDIDSWSKWQRPLSDFFQAGAHLLLDATFYSADELPGRDLDEIPHPLVAQTMDLLDQLKISAKWLNSNEKKSPVVRFLHLNHSNPLWLVNSPESLKLADRGYFLAKSGDRWAF